MIKTIKDKKKKLGKEPSTLSIAVETPPPSLGPEPSASSSSLKLASSSSSLSIELPRAASTSSLSLTGPSKSDVKTWAIVDVVSWMTEEGFAEYAVHFEKNLIDGAALLRLDNDTLKDLGMEQLGIRLKFMAAVGTLTSPPAASIYPFFFLFFSLSPRLKDDEIAVH